MEGLRKNKGQQFRPTPGEPMWVCTFRHPCSRKYKIGRQGLGLSKGVSEGADPTLETWRTSDGGAHGLV